MSYFYTYLINTSKLIFNILLCGLFSIPIVFAGQKDTLVIVRGNHSYPPYEIMLPEKELTGLHIDMILATAKQLGITVEFKSVPWKRALHMIEHGQADAISYISKTEKRQKFAIFDEKNTLSHNNDVFFILNENQQTIHFTGQLIDLKPYHIGTVMGYHYSPELEKATYLKIDKQSKSEDILLERLIRKRFHIGLGDKDQITLLAHQKGVSKKILYLSPALSHTPQYIAFSRTKNHEALAKKFAQTMYKFKQTAAYQDLLVKYQISSGEYE